MTKMSCSIEGCGKPQRARTYCSAHYQRWKRHGDPLEGGTPTGEPEQFYQDVVRPYEGDDCLIWPYSRSEGGYGLIWRDVRMERVCRLVCEEDKGTPPTPEHEAAHSCGKGHLGCVTRRHLSWKTHAENMADTLVHGTHSRGERSTSAKLTEVQVREIRSLKGKFTQKQVSEKYGISPTNVSAIQAGKAWAWLAQEPSL